MDRNLQFSYKQDFTFYISSPNLNIFWFYRAHHFSGSKEILIKYLFPNICSYAVITQSFQSQHLKKKKPRSYFIMSLWLIKKKSLPIILPGKGFTTYWLYLESPSWVPQLISGHRCPQTIHHSTKAFKWSCSSVWASPVNERSGVKQLWCDHLVMGVLQNTTR